MKQNLHAKVEDEDESTIGLKSVLLTIVKQLIRAGKELEVRRQCLFSHDCCNADDLFSLIDKNKNGYISPEELVAIAQSLGLEVASPIRSIMLFD